MDVINGPFLGALRPIAAWLAPRGDNYCNIAILLRTLSAAVRLEEAAVLNVNRSQQPAAPPTLGWSE